MYGNENDLSLQTDTQQVRPKPPQEVCLSTTSFAVQQYGGPFVFLPYILHCAATKVESLSVDFRHIDTRELPWIIHYATSKGIPDRFQTDDRVALGHWYLPATPGTFVRLSAEAAWDAYRFTTVRTRAVNHLMTPFRLARQRVLVGALAVLFVDLTQNSTYIRMPPILNQVFSFFRV